MKNSEFILMVGVIGTVLFPPLIILLIFLIIMLDRLDKELP